MDNLDTGDIILFDYEGHSIFYSIFGSLIKYFTKSNFTHIGVVLNNPTFISPNLKGRYLWQSTLSNEPDVQDKKYKFGVQITPLSDTISKYPFLMKMTHY